MTSPLGAWMTTENEESCRVRRRQQNLEGLQLCRKSTTIGKGVCLIQCMYLVIKGKDVEDAKVLKRYPVLQQFEDVFPT